MHSPATSLATSAAASSAASDSKRPLQASATPSKPKRSYLYLSVPSSAATDLKKLLDFGLTIPGAKFALLSDYVNSRGAADMGLLPDMLPGLHTGREPRRFAEYNAPTDPGLDMLEIFEAAGRGELSALYVVGANPISRYGVDPATLKNTFVVVQEMFLTETARTRRRHPARCKSLREVRLRHQQLRRPPTRQKAADRAGVRTDFEMIVRIADKMGANIPALVPFGTKGLRADMGQSRGAQSGEADRHAVWLTANNLEPKLSPFDPFAILDEIQRLVPGYNLLRLQLLSGNDQHLAARRSRHSVQIGNRRDLVLPANDTLFTSGTLGRYSAMLSDVQQQ